MHLLLAAVLSHWLVVSDVHLDPYDTRPGIVYAHDTNRALWNSALAAMRADVPDPQVVLFGGDALAHHFGSLARSHGEDPYQAGIAVTREIAESLGRAYPRARFLVTLGNNDDPCGDYRSETGGPYQRALARIYAPLVNRDGAAPTFVRDFERGGYYAARLPNGERALVLDTVFDSIVYRGACQSRGGGAAAAQRAWLARELADGERTVLLAHVPPGFDASSTTLARRFIAVPFMRPNEDALLRASLERHARTIAFAVAGHTHRYDFRLAGGVPWLLVSSISPVYRNNPAFYDLRVAPDGTLRDVVPYVYDPADDAWHARPSFDAIFGADAFDAASLTRAHDAIASDADVRARWIDAYDLWSSPDDMRAHGWRVFWCAQSAFGRTYAACAGTIGRTRAAIVAAALALAALVVGIVALVVRRRARLDRA